MSAKKKEKLISRAAHGACSSCNGVEGLIDVMESLTEENFEKLESMPATKDKTWSKKVKKCRKLDARVEKFQRELESSGMNPNGSWKDPLDVHRRSEPLCRAIFNSLDDVGSFMIHGMFCAPFAVSCTALRQLAEAAVEREDQLKWWTMAFDQATDAVRVNYLTQKSLEMGKSNDETAKAIDALKNFFATSLHVRGVASLKRNVVDATRDLTGAIRDLRGAHALYLQLGGRRYDTDPIAADCVKQLLVAMALSKLGTPRPHYTLAERIKTYKELGLRWYSPGEFICHTCGVTTPDLRKCAKCSIVFYCSPQCQRMDWKKHKPDCLPRIRCTLLAEEERDDILADLLRDGYSITSNHRGPSVMVRDPHTHEIYCSLTDQICAFPDTYNDAMQSALARQVPKHQVADIVKTVTIPNKLREQQQQQQNPPPQTTTTTTTSANLP